MNYDLMCILAHPDDESLGTGGILTCSAAEMEPSGGLTAGTPGPSRHGLIQARTGSRFGRQLAATAPSSPPIKCCEIYQTNTITTYGVCRPFTERSAWSTAGVWSNAICLKGYKGRLMLILEKNGRFGCSSIRSYSALLWEQLLRTVQGCRQSLDPG